MTIIPLNDRKRTSTKKQEQFNHDTGGCAPSRIQSCNPDDHSQI
jgi:hypothetical protein